MNDRPLFILGLIVLTLLLVTGCSPFPEEQTATTVALTTAAATDTPTPTNTPTSTPTPTILDNGAQIQTAHCRVNNSGFDVSYALAWANVCEVAYEGYRGIYGLDVLTLNDTEVIEIRLLRQARSRPSLDAYGGIITFRGKEDHLLTPSDGGANNIYGICHEIGHLAFPIDDIYYLEAWADYAASYRIIPYIWEQLGAAAWSQPYDYLAHDGPTDIQRRIEAAADEESDGLRPHYRAVSVLIAGRDHRG